MKFSKEEVARIRREFYRSIEQGKPYEPEEEPEEVGQEEMEEDSFLNTDSGIETEDPEPEEESFEDSEPEMEAQEEPEEDLQEEAMDEPEMESHSEDVPDDELVEPDSDPEEEPEEESEVEAEDDPRDRIPENWETLSAKEMRELARTLTDEPIRTKAEAVEVIRAASR